MKVRYTDTAAVELDRILAYIANRNRAAGVALAFRIERTISSLVEFPEMAQMTDEPGIRRMPVGRYPFLIFYTVEADELVILHIRHTARRLPWEEP
jgi:plasmid stabilization system protein ParE